MKNALACIVFFFAGIVISPATAGEASSPSDEELKSLCEKLGHDDASVRTKAAQRLRVLGEAAAVQLKSIARSANVNQATQAGLILGDFEAVKILLDELANDMNRTLYYSGPTKTQSALAAYSDTAVPFLAHRIRTEKDPLYRFNCVSILDKIRSPEAVIVLRTLAKDPHPWTRTESIWALGNMEDKDSAPIFKEAWKNDSELTVKNEARIALGKVSGIRAFDAQVGEIGMDQQLTEPGRIEFERILVHYVENGKHVDADPVATAPWVGDGERGTLKNLKIPADIEGALGKKAARTVKPIDDNTQRWVLFNSDPDD